MLSTAECHGTASFSGEGFRRERVRSVPFLTIVIHWQPCFPRSMAACGSAVEASSGEVSALIEAPPVIRQQTSKVASLVSVLLLTAAIYGLPWIASSSRNRAGLPAIFGADFYAYLNLSHVFTLSGFPDHDPWYGAPIHPKFGHSTFRAAFVLFGAGRSTLGSDVVASVVWSICWSVLIACSLWLLLRALFDE